MSETYLLPQTHSMVDIELPKPFEGFVETRALYNMDDSKTGLTPCKIFALTSYKDRAPTFKILLEDGSLFSFVPFHTLYHYNPDFIQDMPILDMQNLCWRNCPDYEIALTSPRFLQGRVNCYFLHRDLWMGGEYIASIDWHKDNLIMHLVKLDNAQFTILPSHKVKFHEGDRTFIEYRKLSQCWQVDEGHLD